MTKKENKSDCRDGKPKKANQSANNQTAIPLILKINPVHPSKRKIKLTFKDKDGDMVEERVNVYQDGKAREIILTVEKQLIQSQNAI